ncbi:MAG: dolichyl-phosphate-mannose--protein mannosyltransferase [Desulfovibrionales bacterium]|nr:dolichyl-phosphate-mannose--protein mannosyltransferase [Desulfovibrionales bacterium]
MMNKDHQPGFYWAASLAIIFATTWVRYWFVSTGQLGLSPDEAQYWDWSRTLQWSYYSKGPLIACINALSTTLWGSTELGVRIGAIIGSFLMQVIVLGWIGLGWGRIRTACWSLLIMNTTVLFMAGGLLMTTDNPLLLCWIGALVCFGWAISTGSWPAFIGLGLCLALGIMAKYTMLLFIPLALVAAAWIHKGQTLPQGFWLRLVKTLGVGGLVGVLPIFVWNASNSWVGFKHVLYRGAMAGDKAQVFFTWKYFPEYLGGQLGVLTPWWFVFILLGAWLVTRQLLSQSENPSWPWLERSQAIILVVFFWPVWLFFLFWSVHAKVEANWSAVAYPTGMLLGALAWERFFHKDVRSKWRLVWPSLAAVVFILLHLQSVLPFDGRKNPMYRLRGWSELGQQVQLLMDEELDGGQHTFIFSEQYGLTAALSFYVPGQKRAFCISGDRKMNQYDLWPGPDQAMTTAIFVVKGEKKSVSGRISQLFEEVDEPIVVPTRQGKREGQTFTLFVCRGFNGQWPTQEGETF